MRPIWHIIASFLLSILIFVFTHSVWAGVIALLAGIFIDLDHLIDFWAGEPENLFSIKEFYHMDKYTKTKGDDYDIVFFHSWEWAIILWVLVFYFKWPLLLTSLTLTVTLHFLMDIFNIIKSQKSFFIYFFTYRTIKKFNCNSMFRH